MAATPDALLHRLVDPLCTRLGRDGQQLLFPWFLGDFILFAFLNRSFLLGITGTLLATLVLALVANFVGTIGGAAVVAGTVHTHTDGLLDSLNADGLLCWCRNPLMRLESQSIFGEESTGSLLLENTAIEFTGDGGRRSISSRGGFRNGHGTGLMLAKKSAIPDGELTQQPRASLPLPSLPRWARGRPRGQAWKARWGWTRHCSCSTCPS